jgi:tetratricopeptide (TPR) repeat protein
MTFDEQDDYDYERELFSLLQDFEEKAKSDVGDMFYDIDDWLDIIDFFIAENIESILLSIAIEKSLLYYPKNIHLRIREAYIKAASEPQKGFLMLERIDNDSNIVDSNEAKKLITYQKAKLLIKLERFNEAIDMLNSINDTTSNIFIKEQYALALFKQGDIYNATSELVKTLQLTNVISLKDEDIIGYGAGDFLFLDTALSYNLITLAADLYKNNILTNRHTEISDAIEAIVCSHPLNISYWEMLAEFYLRANESNKAQEAFDYCLSLNPLDIRIYSRKLEAYVNTMDKENECKILRKMMKMLEDKYKETQQIERKKELIDMGVELLRLFIDSCLISKRFDECLELCQMILNMNNHHTICDGITFYSKGEIMIFMAECWLKKGFVKKSLDLAMYAVKMEPEYYGHRIRFAELLYDSGDIPQAEEVFQSLYEQCCEESAKGEFTTMEEKDNAIYFQKHLYYVVAAWAIKMARCGKITEAMSLLASNLPQETNVFDNEWFILKCASIEIISYQNESDERVIELIEEVVVGDGISIDAILHRIPTLYENKNLIKKIKELKQKINNELH